MDLTTVDLSGITGEKPRAGDDMEVLGPHQSVDDLADAAGTIGYEILTALGRRYTREYRS
jgi:alanine racemase